MVYALLVLYDEQAGLVIEHFAPWLDLRVSGILAICANIVSVSVRLYVVFNPPDFVVIYWNLLYYSAVILASVLLISAAPNFVAEIQFSAGSNYGEGQGSMNRSSYDPSLAVLGLLFFMGYCVYRIPRSTVKCDTCKSWK